MFIKDLQPRQTNVDVEGEVVEMSDVREFSKFGRQGKVANALIKDGTGRVKLSLWNEQIEKVRVGDKVKIQKGYVGEFQGELQLTTGKFGTLDVVSKEGVPQEAEGPGAAAKPEPAPAEEKEEPKEESASADKPDDFSFGDDKEDEVPKKGGAPEDPIDVEEEDLS
ncbi:hypothetical protein JW898_05805 [Candidatus Woesearchaeota archaeon]|nr:hypothetical protein [Candidatus Woesearchaeota archaeon]